MAECGSFNEIVVDVNCCLFIYMNEIKYILLISIYYGGGGSNGSCLSLEIGIVDHHPISIASQ